MVLVTLGFHLSARVRVVLDVVVVVVLFSPLLGLVPRVYTGTRIQDGSTAVQL